MTSLGTLTKPTDAHAEQISSGDTMSDPRRGLRRRAGRSVCGPEAVYRKMSRVVAVTCCGVPDGWKGQLF